MRTLLLFTAFLLITICSTKAQVDDKLKGDIKAVELAEKMINQLGGQELWANARTMFIDYKGLMTDPDEEAIELAWRDFKAPNQHMHIKGSIRDIKVSFTNEYGWYKMGNKVTTMPKEQHSFMLDFWPADFYTMIFRLASADPELVLSFQEPRRVIITGKNNSDLGWWDIDAYGNPVKWGATTPSGDALEFVYGPLKKFARVSFPAWGAATDGSWRFYYNDVRLDATPIDPELLIKPENK